METEQSIRLLSRHNNLRVTVCSIVDSYVGLLHQIAKLEHLLLENTYTWLWACLKHPVHLKIINKISSNTYRYRQGFKQFACLSAPAKRMYSCGYGQTTSLITRDSIELWFLMARRPQLALRLLRFLWPRLPALSLNSRRALSTLGLHPTRDCMRGMVSQFGKVCIAPPRVYGSQICHYTGIHAYKRHYTFADTRGVNRGAHDK